MRKVCLVIGEILEMFFIGILDDPLSKYCEIRSKMPEGQDAEFLYKQIGVTAEDNLKLLENVRDDILILPLRLLNQSNDHNSLYKIGEQAFVSLFNGIDSLNDYFAKCESIDDIMQFARDDIENLVMFSEDDNVALPFEERFKVALAGAPYMVDATKSDSHNFFMLVFGCIQQAIDVIVSCIEYGCNPYIRYPVAFHYIALLSDSMVEVNRIKTIRYRMSVAFVTYQLCDKAILSKTSLSKFLCFIRKYDYNTRIFHNLNMRGINEENLSGKIIRSVVLEELQNLYKCLDSISPNE